MWIAAYAWWNVVAIVAISSGYHRYYSHKAFKAGKVYEFFVNFLGIFSGGGPALTWVATHYQHHAYSDTEKDPTSPRYKGIWKVYLNAWGYDVQIERKFVKKLLKDKTLVWWMKNYFKVNVAIVAVLLAIDPMLFLFGYAVPMVFAFNGFSALNVLAHLHGKARNTIVGNLLTAGEGDHEYHHNHPASARITKWFDPTYYFIKAFYGNSIRYKEPAKS